MEDQRAQGGRREKRGRWRREVPVVRNNCDAVPFLSNTSGFVHRVCIISNKSLPQRVLIFHQGQEASPRCQGDPNYAPPDRQILNIQSSCN